VTWYKWETTSITCIEFN